MRDNSSLNGPPSQISEDFGELGLPQWYALLSLEPYAATVDHSTTHQNAERLTVYRTATWNKLQRFGPNKKNVAFFEGYLYDHDLLVGTLNLPKTTDNLQIIAQAYLCWGADMFEHVDGAFLAGVWDESEQRFVIGHDGLSKHPVFYALTKDGLWFSSNILALARSGMVDPTLNRLSLTRRLMLDNPLPGQTFFANIRRLLPGNFLIYRMDGSISEHCYWQPIPEDPEPYYSEERVLSEYVGVLQDAVDREMVLGGDGILLSGGVDSIAVAILAEDFVRRHSLPPLAACCGVPPPDYPQTQSSMLQEPVARALNMPFEPSDFKQRLDGDPSLWRSLMEMPQLPAPEKIYWTGGYMSFYRFLRASGHRMLLSGSGGDEWLGVHDSVAADYWRDLSLGKLMKLVSLRQRQDEVSYPSAARDVLWQAGIKRHLASHYTLLFPARREAEVRQYIQNLIPPWVILDENEREELVASIYDSYTHPVTKDGRKPRSYYWHWIGKAYENPYMTYEFERRFHVCGLTGIRISSPFHDRQVIDFFRHVDPQTLVYAHRNKGLLRHLANEKLPGLGLDRQEKSYGDPKKTKRDAPIEQETISVGRRIGNARVVQTGLVDGQIYENALSNATGSSYSYLVHLFTVMSIESWLTGNGVFGV